jgi:hypothetical protein
LRHVAPPSIEHVMIVSCVELAAVSRPYVHNMPSSSATIAKVLSGLHVEVSGAAVDTHVAYAAPYAHTSATVVIDVRAVVSRNTNGATRLESSALVPMNPQYATPARTLISGLRRPLTPVTASATGVNVAPRSLETY